MVRVCLDLIEQENRMDADFFCSPILPILCMKSEHSIRIDAAQVVDGMRGAPMADQALYSPADVTGMELVLRAEHFQTPACAIRSCVSIGDLIVTKIAPIRIAMVTGSVFRHSIDSNLCVIRGLEPISAFWVWLCLNQPAFGAYLVRKVGAPAVPRVGVDELKSIRLPPPPPGIGLIAARVVECLDERVRSRGELFRFLSLVREEIANLTPEMESSIADEAMSRPTWCRFFSREDFDESWIPSHVALNAYQNRMSQGGLWRPIEDLSTSRLTGGARLSAKDVAAHVLLLGDIADDLTVLRGESRPDVVTARRVYAEPLSDDDVLLSSLVSRPRVAFVGNRPMTPIYPSDNWHRLRFRETPGAWSVILNDKEIHRQLKGLAIGSVQQFAPPATIRTLVLPSVSLETRKVWDQFLRTWQRRRLELEKTWVQLMSDSYQLLQETHKKFGPWTEIPELLKPELRQSVEGVL